MKIDAVEMRELRAQGWTLARLASRYGCTKTGISNYLRRGRTRTNKPRVLRPCACGCGVVGTRKYASRDCYFRNVCKQPYVSWRQGRRIARHVVSKLFPLEPKYVIHHIDGDNRNNDPSNLMVFATHADHMSWHRGGLGRPIWPTQAATSDTIEW